MEVKYQVFVSSTYEDLKEERSIVMETILKLEQIPIGMEMFNAGDEEQWELIKRTIDNSDYYLVIIGGRYGSTASDGLSYTEKEYRYAVETGKPILTFIKKDDGVQSNEGLEKQYHLQQFREHAKGKIASFWSNKDELGRLVAASIHSIISRKPGIGWIRADEYEIQKRELIDLIHKYDELNRLRQDEAEMNDADEARWASDKDIKKGLSIGKIHPADKEYHVAGIPLIVDSTKDEVYVDDSEAHSLIIGSTGSGKTRRIILPLINILSKRGESMVITDPKGELYTHTKCTLAEAGYKIITINLRDPKRGNAWNPLKLPYDFFMDGDVDRALEMLYDLAHNIFQENKGGNQDPFWTNSAADYFCGLALAMFSDAKKEEINLNTILSMDASGEEKFGGSNYIKEYINFRKSGDLSYINASGTVFAPNDTKGSILSVFRQCIKVYASKIELSKMLATNDFDMASIGEEKHAVFIIMQDEKRTYHPLVSTFIKQCYDTLLIDAHSKTGKLNSRVNFVLDEFANITPISDMSSMITAARSRNIRFYLVIQGINQLTSQYGVADADVIKGNCGNWIYLVSKELPILREISELCGTEKIYKSSGQIGLEKPLISVSRLLKMPLGQVLILRDRESPFLSHLPDISSYQNWQKPMSYIKDEPILERDGLHIFDLREFVKNVKKEELLKKMKSDSSDDAKKVPQIDIGDLFN